MQKKVDGRIEDRGREETSFGCPGGPEGTGLLPPDELEISGEELDALLVEGFANGPVDGYHEGIVWLAEELYSSALWEAPLDPPEEPAGQSSTRLQEALL